MCTAQANSMQLHKYQITNYRFRQVSMLSHLKCHIVKDRKIGEERAKLEEHTHLAAYLKQLIPGEIMHHLTSDFDVTR